MTTVFFDIDTQLDFLYPAGALYVPRGERLLPALARLNRYAMSQGHPLLSTMDAHTENDPEFRVWPPHCVAGTAGQHKAAALLHEQRTIVPSRDAEVTLAPQMLIEKQTLQCFSNANLAGLLQRLGADRFVVYGVATEFCVWHAAADLLTLGRPVEIVEDAIEGITSADVTRRLAELQEQGARLTTVAAVCG